MLNFKTTALPFALVLSNANAAGVVVVADKPLLAFTAVPAKALISRALVFVDTQLLDPWVPSRYRVPVPKLATNNLGWAASCAANHRLPIERKAEA